MAISRGGLQYTIQVDGNFAAQFDLFRAELATAKAAWESFKTQLSSTKGAVGAAADATQQLAKDTQDESDATVQAAEADAALTASLQKRKTVEKQLNAEANRNLVIREREALIAEQRQALGERSLIQARAQVSALKQLNTALRKQAEEQEKQALAAKAGFASFAEMETALTAEAVAAQRAAKAQKELAVARLLAAQGLDARGKPIEQGPQFGPLTKQQADQEAANKAQLQFQRELENLQQRVMVKQIADGSDEYKNLQAQLQGASRETRKLAGETDSLENRVNRISFTFRRLFGILAAFAAARAGVQGFVATLRGAVEASSQLEKTKFGLAGLISSVADIRNAQGQILQGQERFNAAQEIAIGIQQRLRTASLGTSASFQEVVDSFQQAFGPGQQAGLGLKEIERATILVASAFDVLGLQAGQLQEEIRAALTGVGKIGQSRIFQLIPQSAIQNAIRANKLLPLLEERLGGVARGAAAVSQSFSGLASNLVDASKLLLAASGKNFYNSIKILLDTARRQIVKTVEGAVVETPQALTAFTALFDGIAAGVSAVTSALKNLDFKSLEQLFGTVGNTIGVVVTAFSGITSALLAGARPILEVTRTLSGTILLLFKWISDLDKVTRGWISLLGNMAGSFVASLLVLKAMAGVFNFLFGKASLVRAAFAAAVASWAKIRVLMFGAVEALTKMVGLSRATTKNMLIVLSVIGVVTVALEKLGVLEKAMEAIGSTVETVLAKADQAVSALFNSNDIQKGIQTSVFEVTQSIATLTRAAGEQLQELRDRIIELGLTAAAQKLTFGVDSGAAEAAQTLQNNLINAGKQSLELEKQRQLVIGKLQQLKEQQASTEDKIKLKTADTNKLLSDSENQDKAITDILNQVLALENQRDEISKRLAKSEGVQGQERLKLLVDQQKIEEKISELQTARRSILADQRGTTILLTEAGNERIKLDTELQQNLVQAKSLEEGQLAIENSMKEIRKQNLELAAKELAILAEKRAIESSIEKRQLGLQAKQAVRRAQPEADANQRAVSLLSGVEEVENAILALQLKREQVGRNNAYWAEQQKILTEANVQDAKSLEAIEKMIAKEKSLGAAQTQAEVAQLELALAKLRQIQQQQGNDLTAGLGRGARDFAQEQTLFSAGEQISKGFLTGLSSTLSQVASSSIAAAFSGQNPQLRQAVSSFLASLGGQIVETLVNRGLALLLQELIPSLFESAQPAIQAAALSEAAAALAASGATLSTSAAGLSGSAVPMNTAAANLDLSSLALDAAAIKWAPVAETLLAAAVLLSTASIAGGAAKGGPAESTLGFAIGGRTPGRHSMPRPRRGLDPRDRIPAWLRFGEWVIRPEAVRTYGHDVMDRINRMQVPPDALRSLAGSGRSGATPGAAAASSSGYATGGAVTAADAPTNQQMPPVIVTDEQFADQVLAGGRKALHRATRRDRNEIRLQLGI